MLKAKTWILVKKWFESVELYLSFKIKFNG